MSNNLLFKKAFPLFFALFVLTGALFFTGCEPDPETEYVVVPVAQADPLVGDWFDFTWDTSNYDGYRITKYTLTQGGGSSQDPATFAGQFAPFDVTHVIADVTYFTADSGVIITLHPTNDTFYGVYFSELTASSMKVSTAYNTSFAIISATSLAAAKTTFTEANRGNHVSVWGGPYLKN
jgi:hypothetical protein